MEGFHSILRFEIREKRKFGRDPPGQTTTSAGQPLLLARYSPQPGMACAPLLSGDHPAPFSRTRPHPAFSTKRPHHPPIPHRAPGNLLVELNSAPCPPIIENNNMSPIGSPIDQSILLGERDIHTGWA